MIHTNRVVTVGDQESIIDKPIILYRGDREVEVEFELIGNEFMFSTDGNVIKSVNASHGQLVLNTPSGDNMFSELAECHDGKVVFVITKEMIDEFIEIGFYSFQIRLYDGEQMKSRVTIPPVFSGLDIRNPIAAEDETNVVGMAVVDYARIYRDQSNEELPTFDWRGNYVKTDWVHHDVITENKMNKIEDGLWTINNKISESDNVFLKKAEDMEKQRQNDVNKLNTKDTQLSNDIQNVNRNLTNAVDTLRVDMEINDITLAERIGDIELELTNISDNMKYITAIMPKPASMVQNSTNLQNILDIAKNGDVNLTVLFQGGTYGIHTSIIYDNTTIKMTNNTILRHKTASVFVDEDGVNHNARVLFLNAKPYDAQDSSITGYNGRSNITIEGGVIQAQCAMALCHGQNITLRNIHFVDADSDHYLQIGACKNVKIQNCTFEGMRIPEADRSYVEYVQLDWMSATAMPYWLESSAIFDHTTNDGVEIDGCRFKPNASNPDYSFMGTGLGSHSADEDRRNKNIVIKNCEFVNYGYAGLRIRYMENVIIENNRISSALSGNNGIYVDNSINVIMNNNIVDGGSRGVFSLESDTVIMNQFIFKNINGETGVLIGENQNVTMTNNRFIGCTFTGANTMIRNTKGFTANVNADMNTSSNGNFYHIYTRDGGANELISINNTITDKNEVNLISAKSVMCSTREVLWSGQLKSDGTATLNDDISKFKNLKMQVSCYGMQMLDLNFVNNSYLFKTFNMADDLSGGNLNVAFIEFKLTLSGKTITMSNANVITIKDGEHTSGAFSGYVSEISGERIKY